MSGAVADAELKRLRDAEAVSANPAVSNPGFGNLPNTLAGWGQLGTAALAGAGVVFGGVPGLAGIGGSMVTGKAPGLMNTFNAIKSGGMPASPDSGGLSSGNLSAPGDFGVGNLGGTMAGGLNGIGDITQGGVQHLAHGGRVRAGAKAKGAPVFGMVRGAKPGVDTVLANLAEGSYVVPRRVIAAVGKSPADHFEKQYGKPGDHKGPAVEAKISGGEYVMSPSQVEKAGGHDALDRRFGISTFPKTAFADGGGVLPTGDSAVTPPTSGVPIPPPVAPPPAPPPKLPGGDLASMMRGQLAEGETVKMDLADRAKKMATDLDALKTQVSAQPKPQQTDPVNAFGSAAMFLASMGSLMTRRPMTNALSSSAKVLETFKANDAAATKQAFDQWKTATDQAIHIQQFENDAYRAALEGDKTALAVTAAALKDHVVLNLLENGQRDYALEIITGRRRQSGAMGAQAIALQDAYRRNAAATEYQKILTTQGPEAAAAFKANFIATEGMRDPSYAQAAGAPDLAARKEDRANRDLDRREASDRERARHSEAVEGLAAQRFDSEDARRKALSDESHRHNEALEGIYTTRNDQTDRRLDQTDRRLDQADEKMAQAGTKTPTMSGALTTGAIAQAKEEVERRKAAGEKLSPGDEAKIQESFIAKAFLAKSPYMQTLNALEADAVRKAVDKDPSIAGDLSKLGQAVRDATGRSVASPKELDDIENHGREYAQVLDALDKMKSQLGSAFTVGLGGKIGRPAEAIGNITGAMDSTTRADFYRNMELVQTAFPQLFSYKGVGSAGKANDERIGKIVRGGNLGDTGQNVLTSIQALQDMFGEDVAGLNAQHMKHTGKPLPALSERGVGGTPAPAQAGKIIRYDAQGNRVQ